MIEDRDKLYRLKVEDLLGYEIYFIPSRHDFEIWKDGKFRYHYGALREVKDLIKAMARADEMNHRQNQAGDLQGVKL
jgi:hypothetical protein